MRRERNESATVSPPHETTGGPSTSEAKGREGGTVESSSAKLGWYWAKFGIAAGSKVLLAFSSDTERTLRSFSNNPNLPISVAVALSPAGGLSPPSSRFHLSPPEPRLARSTRGVGGEPRVSGCLACAYVRLLKCIYTANIAATATTNTPADIPSTAPVDIGELVGCEVAEDDGVELVRGDDESVTVIGSLGLRALEIDGTGEAEGPSNKLLPRLTDTAVVPPPTPEAEGATGASLD